MQRLKTRQQFQAVMDGVVVSRTAHFALHRLALPPASSAETDASGAAEVAAPPLFADSASWIGALVPKRWARRAVTRNAIKRQIYTVSAVHAESLLQAAHVVRLRSAFDRAAFPSATSEPLKRAVRAELEQLLTRAASGGGRPPPRRTSRPAATPAAGGGAQP